MLASKEYRFIPCCANLRDMPVLIRGVQILGRMPKDVPTGTLAFDSIGKFHLQVGEDHGFTAVDLWSRSDHSHLLGIRRPLLCRPWTTQAISCR